MCCVAPQDARTQGIDSSPQENISKEVESTTEKQLVLMDNNKGTFFHVQLGMQFKIINNK